MNHSFNNRDNVRVPIQFEREKQSKYQVLLDQSNKTSWVFPALKSTSHYFLKYWAIYVSSNATFVSNIESVQYNAALAITGVIRGLSREKLHLELGLEYQHYRCWMRQLCFFYKVLSNEVPKSIYDLISLIRHPFRNSNTFFAFWCGINDWNEVSLDL